MSTRELLEDKFRFLGGNKFNVGPILELRMGRVRSVWKTDPTLYWFQFQYRGRNAYVIHVGY